MSFKQLKLRGDTAANWTNNDPTLAEREIGIETDTLLFKIGDGSTAWTSLAYAAITPANISGTANEINVADDGSGGVTIGIVDPLIVSKGGTGVATLTDHSVLLGSGTDAITSLGVATDGQLVIGSTGADPTLATLTGTANQVSVTNGAGSITLSTPQDIATDSSPTFDDLTLSNPSNIYALSHDSFTDFVADEHVTHTSVTLTAGTGLTGGGDISTNRTFAVDGVLEDLDTLGAASSDGEFIVATGAGTFSYESGATARTSMGIGTTDSPQFNNITIADAGTIGSVSDPDAITIEADGDIQFSQGVGIGKSSGGKQSLDITYTVTDDDWESVQTRLVGLATQNGDYNCYSYELQQWGTIGNGVSNTGDWEILHGAVLRNYVTNGDTGTLANLGGAKLYYGHASNDASTPTTTNVYGLYLLPYKGTGTITNKYDIYIGDYGAAGGVINNEWGIYQDNTATNYLKGETRINAVTKLGDGGDTNYIQIGSNGDVSFTGTAGFYPRVLNQSAEPAAGTGATQCDTGELVVWTDTDDSKCYLCYNHGGTVKTVEMV